MSSANNYLNYQLADKGGKYGRESRHRWSVEEENKLLEKICEYGTNWMVIKKFFTFAKST